MRHAFEARTHFARDPYACVIGRRDYDLDPLQAEPDEGVFGERPRAFMRHPLAAARRAHPVSEIRHAMVGIDAIETGTTKKSVIGGRKDAILKARPRGMADRSRTKPLTRLLFAIGFSAPGKPGIAGGGRLANRARERRRISFFKGA